MRKKRSLIKKWLYSTGAALGLALLLSANQCVTVFADVSTEQASEQTSDASSGEDGSDSSGGTEDAGENGGSEAGEDGGSEAGEDGGSEAGEDSGSEAGEDGGSEAGEDGGSEAGEDSGSEAGEDRGSEAGEDGGSEAGEDSGSEAGEDGGSEAGEDSGSETGEDSGSEVGEDSGPEVGEDSGSEAGAGSDSEAGDASEEAAGGNTSVSDGSTSETEIATPEAVNTVSGDAAVQTEETAAQTEETAAQAEETAAQTEETAAQAEETAAQTEETAAQTEETAAQAEETAAQAEETAGQERGNGTTASAAVSDSYAEPLLMAAVQETAAPTLAAADTAVQTDSKDAKTDAEKAADQKTADQKTADQKTADQKAADQKTADQKPAAETIIKNALQDQIDKLLKEAKGGASSSAPEKLVLEIKEGEYTGDLSISSDILSDAARKNAEGVALYLLADGSFSKDKNNKPDTSKITANAGGGTKLKGNLSIDGLNVILGGLYFSLNQTISIRNSLTNIYGTKKDDNISILLEKGGSVIVLGGNGADTITVAGKKETADTAAASDDDDDGNDGSSYAEKRQIYLSGGAGADVYAVDLSVGTEFDPDQQEALQGADVVLLDSDGGRMHLSGSLKKNGEGSDVRISQDPDYNLEMHIVNSDGHALNVRTEGINSFSDELENKKERKITDKDLLTGRVLKAEVLTGDAFVNYVYEGAASGKSITILNSDAAMAGMFSDLVIGKPEKAAAVNGKIVTNGMNVNIYGTNIAINGTVDAGIGNVIVRAKDSDAYFNFDAAELYKKYMPEELKELLGKDAVPSNIKASVFQVKTDAEISVKKGAVVKGSSVDFRAENSQTKPLVPFEKLEGLNFVSVKIGTAKISINGNITAEQDFTSQAYSHIKASASNRQLSDYYIPAAVGVLLGEADVAVGGASKIKARTVQLYSDSTADLVVDATVGAMPLSVGTAAIMNDSHVTISGTSAITAEENITAAADGRILSTVSSQAKTAKTKSDAKSKEENKEGSAKEGKGSENKNQNRYGAFFAVNVALQDVSAEVLDNASLNAGTGKAGGHVMISADAVNHAVTSAKSSLPESSSEGEIAESGETASGDETDGKDKRSAGNSEKTAANLLEAAKGEEDADGKIRTANGKVVTDAELQKLDKLKTAVTGSDGESGSEEKNTGIAEAVDAASEGATSEKKTAGAAKNSSLQLCGALSVNVVKNNSTAVINTTKKVTAKNGELYVMALSETASVVTADASSVAPAEKAEGSAAQNTSKKALGTAIALNIVSGNTISEIRKGQVNAKQVKVTASSGMASSADLFRTEALSGISEDTDKFGLAGAIAVEVSSLKSSAQVLNGVVLVLTNSGELSVSAASSEENQTSADGSAVTSSGEGAGKTGIGGAIAVVVNGADVIASAGTEDAALQINSVGTVTVDANHYGKMDMNAKAGAMAKTAVSPAAAFMVSGSMAKSTCNIVNSAGKPIINLSGDLNVLSLDQVERTADADASTSGGSSGVGAALVITVLNDSSRAVSKQSVKANNIIVKSDCTSWLNKARARASAQGAASSDKGSEDSGDSDPAQGEEGTTDQQADKAVDSLKKITDKNSTESMNTEQLTKLTKDRQKAETAEGNMDIAASFVLNIMSTDSLAAAFGDTLTAKDQIEIMSNGAFNAALLADSSAVAAVSDSDGKVKSGGSYGIGTAAALNIVNYGNKAYIDHASITAAGLTVSASVLQESQGEESGTGLFTNKPNVFETAAVSGAGAGNVGVAGSIALAVVKGDTQAYIGKPVSGAGAANIINVPKGKLKVCAASGHDEKTIASSSIVKAEDGEETPETNDEEFKKADEDNKKAEDGTKVSSVDKDSKAGSKEDTSSEENENPSKTEGKHDKNNNASNPNNKKGSAVGVGASAALDFSDTVTKAFIAEGWVITAGVVDISANAEMSRRTAAVAGTDPEAKGALRPKTAVDAAMAFLLENDQVLAMIARLGTEGLITTNGDLSVTAKHKDNVRTEASGLAVGSQSAVGASVAVSIASGNTRALFLGDAGTAGSFTVTSTSEDTVRSVALATAKGTTEDKAKKGGKDQPSAKNKKNKTAEKINKALNANKSADASKKGAQSDADASSAVSTNVLKTMDVKTEGTEEGTKTGNALKDAKDTANKEVTNKKELTDGKDISSGAKTEKQKAVAAAAALGITVACHTAETEISGRIVTNGSGIKAAAENLAVFSAYGTGLTMTQIPDSKAVALGAAVDFSKNKAILRVYDGTVLNTKGKKTTGDITLESVLTQNANDYHCGAQAVSGSISKKANAQGRAPISAAGAVAVLVTEAEAQTNVGKNVTLNGGNVSVRAKDSYKLYVRAGSLSYTNQANKGLGASFGMIYSDDKVLAVIGDNLSVTGKSFTAEAVRQSGNTSALTGWLAKAIGIGAALSSEDKLVVKDGKDGKSVQVEKASLKSAYSTNVIGNAVNVFINDTYHIEAFSGSFSTASSDFTGAGAAALAFLNNQVNAEIGKNARITITGKDGMTLKAEDRAETGIYAFGISGSAASKGAGASVSVLSDQGTTLAKLGDGAVIVARNGGYTQKADWKNEIVLITGAAAVAAKSGSDAYGGNINVLISDHKTEAAAGNKTNIKAANEVSITSSGVNTILLIAADAQGSGGTALGGTFSAVILNNDTKTTVGDGTLTSGNGGVSLTAHGQEKLLSVLASLSAGVGGSGTAAAGAINILISRSKINVSTGKINISAAGDVTIRSDLQSEFTVINASAGATGGSMAVGAVASVDLLNNEVRTVVDNGSVIKAGGNVLIDADALDHVLVILGNFGASSESAFGGVIAVTIGKSTVEAVLSKGTEKEYTTVEAQGTAAVSTYLDSEHTVIGGGIEASGTNAIGGVISTVLLTNTVNSEIGDYAKIRAYGQKVLVLPAWIDGTSRDKKKRVRGICVTAGSRDKIRTIEGSGAASGNLAVSGVISTQVLKNKVTASARQHTTLSALKKTGEEGSSGEDVPGDVEVSASDPTDIINAAGSLSASGSTAVGASIVVVSSNKSVEAYNLASLTESARNVDVTADADDSLFLVAVSLGASGTVAVAAAPNVLTWDNFVKAEIGSQTETRADGSVLVRTSSKCISNAVAAVISASGTAAVSGEAVLVFFYNISTAEIGDGASVKAEGGVSVRADSSENLNTVAAGLAGSGTAGVGGAVNVVITKVKTIARLDRDTVVQSGASVMVNASDEYNFLAVTGSAAGAGAAGVSVGVLASVSHNTVNAEIGDNSKVTAKDSVHVAAVSNRRIQAFTISAAVGGAAGVSGSVSVISAGSRLSKEARDGIYVSGSSGSTMKPEEMVNTAFSKGDSRAVSGSYAADAAEALKDNGESAKDIADKGAGKDGYEKYGQDDSDREKVKEGKLTDSLMDQTSDNMTSSAKQDEMKDTTLARVGKGASVTAQRGYIYIQANETLTAGLVTGGAAAGGAAGIGAGVSVVLLRSDVEALAEAGSKLDSADKIYIEAKMASYSGKRNDQVYTVYGTDKSFNSSEFIKKGDEAEKDASGSAQGQDANGIYLLSFTAGGGTAGITANVAYLNTAPRVEAVSCGDMSAGSGINVQAFVDLGRVSTVTVGISGGVAAVTGTVALAFVDGDVKAGINGTSDKMSAVRSSKYVINVGTNVSAELLVINTAMGGGAVSVNVPVSVAVNRINAEAFVGQYTDLETAGNVNVTAGGRNRLSAYMLTLGGGAVSVGTAVTVANNRMENYAYIGTKPGASRGSGSIGKVKADNVNVLSSLRSDTEITGAGLSAGAVAVNAAVALAFQNSRNIAAIGSMNVETTRDISVHAGMKGDTETKGIGAGVGVIGVGAIVSVARNTALNHAYADITDSTVTARNLYVTTGELGWYVGSKEPYESHTGVLLVTGSAGAAAVSINYARAENRSTNNAEIRGSSGTLDVSSGHIEVGAYGRTTALALAANGGMGLFTANVIVAKALLNGTQNALITGKGRILARSLSVISDQNKEGTRAESKKLVIPKIKDQKGNEREGISLNVAPKTMADAIIYNGALGVAAAGFTTAEAKSDMTVTAKADAPALIAGSMRAEPLTVEIRTSGASKAYAEIRNLAADVIGVGILNGTATAAGKYEASYAGDGSIYARNVNVRTDYVSSAQSDVTPAAGGIGNMKISLLEAGYNASNAFTSTEAVSFLKLREMKALREISVVTSGTADATANIHGAKFTVNGIAITANRASARTDVKQSAYITGSGSEKSDVAANSIEVISQLNGVSAAAKGGTNDGGKSINLVNTQSTLIEAYAYTENEAWIGDVNAQADERVTIRSNAASFTDRYTIDTSRPAVVNVSAEAEAPSFAADIIKSQVTETKTNTGTKATAGVRGDADVKADTIDIFASDISSVHSKGSAPVVSLTLVGGESIKVVTEAAKDEEKTKHERLVKVYTEPGTSVSAMMSSDASNHHLSMCAYSDLTVSAELNPFTSIGGLKLGKYIVGTDTGKLSAEAEVAGQLMSGADIIVRADNKVHSNVKKVEAVNAGLLSGATAETKNNVGSLNALISVGDAKEETKLSAVGSITLESSTAAEMQNEITASNYGGGTRASLTSSNVLNRNTVTKLSGKVAMTAQKDISILATADSAVLTGKAIGFDGGLIQKSNPYAEAQYLGDTEVVINGQSNISAVYGTVRVVASAVTELKPEATYSMKGAIESNQPKAVVQSGETVLTTIAASDGEKAKIVGNNTEIGAYIHRQQHIAKSVAKTTSLGTDTEATSQVKSQNRVGINAGNADITGTKQNTVSTKIMNLREEASSESSISGFTGQVTAKSDVSGNSEVFINFGTAGKTILRGHEITVENYIPDVPEKTVFRSTKAASDTIISKGTNAIERAVNVVETQYENAGSWITKGLWWIAKTATKVVLKPAKTLIEVVTYAGAHENKTGSYVYAGNANLKNTEIYLGKYAGGVNIDIDQYGKIKSSGVTEEQVKEHVLVGKDAITVTDVKSDSQGSLTIYSRGDVNGNVKLNNNSYIPQMTINNHTDLPLIVKDLRMAGIPEKRSEAVFKTGGKLNLKVEDEQEFDPKLIINSYGKGDVVFGSKDGQGTLPDTSLLSGSLEVHMNKKGGSVRTEYNGVHDSFISANSVVIDGALEIGESSKNPLRIFAMNYDTRTEKGVTTQKAILKLDADRGIYAELVPVLLYESYRTPVKAAVEVQSLNAAETVLMNVRPALVSAWNNARRDDLQDYDSGTERHYQYAPGHDVDVEIPGVKTKTAEFQLSDLSGRNGNGNDRSAVIRSKDGTYVEAASVKTDKSNYTGRIGEFKLNTRTGGQNSGSSGNDSGSGSDGKSGKKAEKDKKANEDYQKLIEQDAERKSGGKQKKLKDDETNKTMLADGSAAGNQSAALPGNVLNDGQSRMNALFGADDFVDLLTNSRKHAADLFRIVEKNGWSYLLKADYIDPANGAEMLAASAEKILLTIAGIMGGWKMLLDTMAETGNNGGQMRLVTAGAGLALLIFLLLTRRRRKEEEEG